MKDIFEGEGQPLSDDGFKAAMKLIGGDKESLWSLLRVETRGFGFLPDRRPKILFERHVFHGRTGGRFARSHPDLSHPKAGGYIGGAAEYQRLKRAMLLDRRGALESASWGLGQVMGFNATKIGYPSAEAMITAFAESEDEQLEGCARFIKATPALERAYQARNWARVAFFYNGAAYAKNSYDTKLASAYVEYLRECPKIEVRRVQAFLTYLGFNPNGIDGVMGGGTRRALDDFRRGYRPGAGLPDLPAANSLPDAYLPCLEPRFRARFASPVMA